MKCSTGKSFFRQWKAHFTGLFRDTIFKIVTGSTPKGHMTATLFLLMTVVEPLILQELTVLPGGEWSPQLNGWAVVRVTEGAGYCLRAGNATGLNPGDGLMLPASAPVLIRASQLGLLRLQFFQIEPKLLGGLLTLTEDQQIKEVPPDYISFFKADEPAGQKFARLAGLSCQQRLDIRCALLQLWAGGITDLFSSPDQMPVAVEKLRQRFCQLVGQMPEARLFEHSLADLAQKLNCTERHLKRLFREEFGISFPHH